MEAEASVTAEKIRAGAEEIEQKRLEAERLFEAWKEQFQKTQAEARADFAAHLAEQREELRGNASIVIRDRSRKNARADASAGPQRPSITRGK